MLRSRLIEIPESPYKVRATNAAPLGLIRGGRYVSIHIPPRWGCHYVPPSLFFCELRLCQELSEKLETLENHA